jgi:hypothetical protein
MPGGRCGGHSSRGCLVVWPPSRVVKSSTRVHNRSMRRGGGQRLWLRVAGLGCLALVVASCSSTTHPESLHRLAPSKQHATTTTTVETTTTTTAAVTMTGNTQTTDEPTTGETEPPQAAAPTTRTTTCIEVPNVMGESYVTAVNELRIVGFRPWSGGVPAPNEDAAVVSEIPAGGSCVAAGTAVQLAAPGP